MTLIKIRRGKTLAMAGLMCLMTGFASAQDDTGIVRITDRSNTVAKTQIMPTKYDQVFRAQSCDDNCVPGSACDNGAGSQGRYSRLFGGSGNGAGQSGNCQNGTCQNCQNGTCQNGNGQNGDCPNCQDGTCQDGNCPSCQNGTCPDGNSPNCRNNNCRGGYGYPGYGCRNEFPVLTWLGFCQPNYGCPNDPNCNGCGSCCGKLSMSARRLLSWIDPCSGTCSYSPMYGFTPPSKRPYFRQPVSYQHNYPAKWNGGVPSGYHGHRPAVYMPTDTTQLGYYYQKVPTWVPVPGMIPAAPQPAEWHYYGQNNVTYAPCEVAPATDAKENKAIEADDAMEKAPIPPMPPEVEKVKLEKSASRPRLLRILDTTK